MNKGIMKRTKHNLTTANDLLTRYEAKTDDKARILMLQVVDELMRDVRRCLRCELSAIEERTLN